MRELNLEEFPDELCQVKFSFDEACEQVGSQTLIKELAKDPIIEKSKLPFFALTMWNHILKFQKILTHEEFNSKYFEEHHDVINGLNLNDHLKKCLLGRMYRAYGSLVRDCLFSLQLKEELSQFGVEVIFNRKLDTGKDTEDDKGGGIDVLLLYKGKKFGLNLFLDSEDSREWRKAKEEYRHEKYNDVIMTNLPCPFGGRIVIGKDIWMYGITDRNIVREALGLPIIKRTCPSMAVDSFNLFS